MSVTVLIPTVLQKLTSGADVLTADGQTVGEILASLRDSHAALVQRITTEEGGFKPFLNVFVNGEDIRFTSELATPVRAGDEVSIVPSIAGG